MPFFDNVEIISFLSGLKIQIKKILWVVNDIEIYNTSFKKSVLLLQPRSHGLFILPHTPFPSAILISYKESLIRMRKEIWLYSLRKQTHFLKLFYLFILSFHFFLSLLSGSLFITPIMYCWFLLTFTWKLSWQAWRWRMAFVRSHYEPLKQLLNLLKQWF